MSPMNTEKQPDSVDVEHGHAPAVLDLHSSHCNGRTQDTTPPPSPVTAAMVQAALSAAGYFDRPQSRKDMRAALEAAIAAQAPQASPDRSEAIRTWGKYCAAFRSVLGDTPASPVIDAMLDFAQAQQAQGAPASVPRIATPEMRARFREAYREGGFWSDRLDYALDQMRAAAPQEEPQTPAPAAWVPHLSARAAGVAGHYAIARWNPAGYREVWNLRNHRWASASDDVLSLEEADSLLRQIVIPTVKLAGIGTKGGK